MGINEIVSHEAFVSLLRTSHPCNILPKFPIMRSHVHQHLFCMHPCAYYSLVSIVILQPSSISMESIYIVDNIEFIGKEAIEHSNKNYVDTRSTQAPPPPSERYMYMDTYMYKWIYLNIYTSLAKNVFVKIRSRP